MSLVSTYIQATDGRFYRDPIIHGPAWYICYDDNDPIELVIMRGESSVAPQDVLETLRQRGYGLVLASKAMSSGRMFNDGKMHPARAWWLRHVSGAPKPAMLRTWDGRQQAYSVPATTINGNIAPQAGDCTFYAALKEVPNGTRQATGDHPSGPSSGADPSANRGTGE